MIILIQMRIKQPILWLAGTIFGLFLDLYLFFLFLFGNKLKNEAREITIKSKKTNPNKMLFISCGGFIE